MTACPVDAMAISSAEAKVVLDDVCVGCKLCTIACQPLAYRGDLRRDDQWR
jgi:Fe-S-cluster-containing hydrogenase component 2